jgi:hypothetical protein
VLVVYEVSEAMIEENDPSIFAARAFPRTTVTVLALALAGCGGPRAMLAPAPQLVQLRVIPQTSSIALGQTITFSATAVFRDGSEVDETKAAVWKSSTSSVATVDAAGHVQSHSIGTATIQASVNGTAGAATLSVSAAKLTSIAVTAGNFTLPLGASGQMTATGSYTDASTRDLTNSVSWSSASQQIVSISSSGIAGAKGFGATVISAVLSAIRGSATVTVSAPALVSIDVSPSNPAVPLGRGLQLKAIGSLTDGTTRDISSSVTWAVVDPTVANLNGSGYATAVRVGSTGARASFGGIQGAATILVEPIAAVSYFTATPKGTDTTLRMTNPDADGPNLCAMVYVFSQDQQMAECCGCQISRDGLRTFSLKKDLIGNPLTGLAPTSGSVFLVPADSTSNPSCDPSAIKPTGTAIAWATHLPGSSSNSTAVSEESLSETPLSATLAAALQTQCYNVQQLGNGQGICSCGTGH